MGTLILTHTHNNVKKSYAKANKNSQFSADDHGFTSSFLSFLSTDICRDNSYNKADLASALKQGSLSSRGDSWEQVVSVHMIRVIPACAKS